MSVPGKEAEIIFHAIFNKKIPASIQTHFNIISKKIDGRFAGEEVKKYYECIEKVHDLEALEVAARYFKKLPILTEKFNIMVYLSETLPENYPVFVSERNNFFLAYILLISSLFHAGYKIAKGMVLLAANRI